MKNKILLLGILLMILVLPVSVWSTTRKDCWQDASGENKGTDWHSLVTYVEKQGTKSTTITLLGDMDIAEPLVVTGTLRFLGTTKVFMTRQETYSGVLLYVAESGSLTLDGPGLILDGKTLLQQSDCAILVKGYLKMNQGMIRNNQNLGNSLKGDEFSGCGGGIQAGTGSNVYLNGGTIENCYATGNGGGVFSQGYLYCGSITMTGNEAAGYGGAIYTENTCRMVNGRYEDNKAFKGSLLGLSEQAQFIVSGRPVSQDPSIYLGGQSIVTVMARLAVTTPFCLEPDSSQYDCGRILVESTYNRDASAVENFFILAKEWKDQDYLIRNGECLATEDREEYGIGDSHLYLSRRYQITYNVDPDKGTISKNHTQEKLWQEPLILNPPDVTVKRKYLVIKGWATEERQKIYYQGGQTYVDNSGLSLWTVIQDTRKLQIQYLGNGARNSLGEEQVVDQEPTRENEQVTLMENCFGTFRQNQLYRGTFYTGWTWEENDLHNIKNSTSFQGWVTLDGRVFLAGSKVSEEMLSQLAIQDDDEFKTVTFWALWDQFPEITTGSIQVTLQESLRGELTEEFFGKLVSFYDLEGECSLFFPDFVMEDYTRLNGPCVLSLLTGVRDTAGNQTIQEVQLFINQGQTQKWRFISKDYIWDLEGNFRSYENGGLWEDSLWKQGQRKEVLDVIW